MDLPRTAHRVAVLTRVLDWEICAVPQPNGSVRWRKRDPDLFAAWMVGALPAATSKALGELLRAKLIRVSAAAPRTSEMKGVRHVFATDAGRDWWRLVAKARRGCSNSNRRGSAKARRLRKQWLLDKYGDGVSAACWLAVPGVCAGPVTFETLTVERVTPGHAGGSYRRDNIRPACQRCQSRQGGQFGTLRRQQAERDRRALRAMHI